MVVFIEVVDTVVVVVDVVEVELDMSSTVDDSSSVKSVSTSGAAVVSSIFYIEDLLLAKQKFFLKFFKNFHNLDCVVIQSLH